MNTVWAHHTETAMYQSLLDFITGLIWGKPRQMSAGTIMAVADGGDIIGAVLYHNYQPEEGVVELTIASTTPRWLSRAVLSQMFDYAFNALGCQLVVLRSDATNAAVGRIARRFGFESVRIPRLLGRDKDEIIHTLTDDAWRANGYGKEIAHG